MEEPEKQINSAVPSPPDQQASKPTTPALFQYLTRTRSSTQIPSRAPSATRPPPLALPHELALIAIISTAQLLTQASLAQSLAPLHIIGASFSVSNPGTISWLPSA